MQLAFTTVDEFHGLLEQAGEALDYREVWPRLFPVANCPPELMRKLVDDIVEGDERFAWESDVHVGLAAWRARRRDLADVAFTVVDLETTGATPGFSKITEIGAVRIEGGREVGTFSALVNPGMPIPAMITGITGIDDETVAGAPPIEVVLPRFVDFAAHSVLVAHNAPFDLGFLDYELGRQRGQTFPRPALDTLRLARKLCPQQRCSLSALAYRFDTRVKPVHRALHDAQATGELLLLFLSWLQEQGMNTLEEVARFCEPGDAAQLPQDLAHGEAPDHARRLPHEGRQGRAALHRQGREPAAPHARPLPAAPGLPRPAGARAPRAHRRRRDRLGVRRAAAREPADREAPAAVQLARHQGQQLPLRQAQRRGVPAPVRHAQPARRRRRTTPGRSARPAWPGASSTASTAPTRCAPARTCRASGREHACQRAGTGACLSPCSRPLNGEYAAVVADVRRVLEGDADDLDRRLVERQAALVKPLAFEQAARLQNQRETLGARGARRAPPARRAARRPRARLPGAPARLGRALGRPRRRHRRSSARWAAGRSASRPPRGVLAELAAAEPPRPPLPAAAIDEMLLVHSWVDAHRAAPGVVDLRAFVAGGEDLRVRRRPAAARRPARRRRRAGRRAAVHGAATAAGAAAPLKRRRGRRGAPAPRRPSSLDAQLAVTPPSPSGAASARSARWR